MTIDPAQNSRRLKAGGSDESLPHVLCNWMMKLWIAGLLGSGLAFAQMQDMPGMQGMHEMHGNYAGMFLMDQATGTSMNPQSWKMPMLMFHEGKWDLMLMGSAFLVDTQQSGPRGGDKFYSANMLMGMAERSVGRGTLMFETMLSLEPATVADRRYPLLFQTGETAYGIPLVDAQHPHNFVMDLGIQYARPIGPALLQLYYAPVGDPALGPVAYPHRASASEIPQAPLSHHWQDSTHIANNVVTAAVKYGMYRLEASGFYGTEPGENRWTIGWGPINSYSVRFSVFPTKNWMFQVSSGHLTQPERQEVRDVTRTTASAHYTRGDWSSSLVWGRNANRNSYLAETVKAVLRKNFVTGRFEVVDKDELAQAGVFRITAYTGGYTRDIGTFQSIETGIGANVSGYSIPSELTAAYGKHPFGVNVFLRLRLKPR